MTQTITTFDTRLKKLVRKHRRMADGVVSRIGADGLVTAHPRRRTPSFPWRQVFLLVVAAVVFKAFLYTYLGASTYQAHLMSLNGATVADRIGSGIMQIDPITRELATWFDTALSAF